MNKKKILWLSDSPTTTTGFATITRNILNGLKNNYECHCLGHNYIGQTLTPPITFEDSERLDFHLHGTGKAKYSLDKIKPIISKYHIDIFGGLLDTFMLYESDFMNCDLSPAFTFWYYPSDGGGGLPQNCENILKKIHLPIAMSKFAQKQVLKVHGINSEYIPHGYDPKIFYPLPQKEKEKIRKDWALTNKFVVGVVARNQPRKQLDRTIKAFALFCRDKPEVVLLLHCDPLDMAAGFSIINLIKRLKLNNRVLFTGTTFYDAFDYTKMNQIYNLMDVFFLSTSGEGFGVPIIEAMACGVPQLITDYTTTKELVIDNGQTGEAILLTGEDKYCPDPHCDEILDGTITGGWDVERGIMSIYDAVDKLNKLYNDRNLLKKYGKVGIEKAKIFYAWDVVMPMWRNVLNKLGGQK